MVEEFQGRSKDEVPGQAGGDVDQELSKHGVNVYKVRSMCT